MKFKSIQFSVAALAGAIVLSIVAALVLYAVISGARTQDLVEKRTQEQFDAVIEQRLTSLAQTQASQILRRLEAPLLIARGIATTNAQIGMKDEAGNPRLSVDRAQLIGLLKQTLVDNPLLLGTYIAWEPNGVDRNDAGYVGTAVEGIDPANGRFQPWWYRNTDGTLGLEKLVDLSNDTLLSTGVRASEYYLCSKESKRACTIDPAPYKVGDKMVMLASFIQPILIDGQFQGIVGADLSVNFIQDLLKAADAQLYSGAGELALIANNGRLVAYTKDENKFGEKASDVLPAAEAAGLAKLSGDTLRYEIDRENGQIRLFLPFQIGETAQRWTLLIDLPLSAVMADAEKMQNELSEQRRTDITGMTLVGLAIAALGLLVIWLLAHGIARPLRQMVAMLDDIAQGEG
ncbi:MAG TPA: methyl-accepting chemotaxis protein, partial [Pseudomonas sp.]|nr:methyl-accepting chemotaxis protein [Pseudomonas sp.]